MGTTQIEIQVPLEVDSATLAEISALLPEGASLETRHQITITVSEFLARAFDGAPLFFGALSDWWAQMRLEGGQDPAIAVLISFVIVAVAYGLDRGLARLTAQFVPDKADVRDSFGRILAAARWGCGRVLSLLVFFAVAQILLTLVAAEGSTLWVVGPIVVASALRFRIIFSVIDLLAAPVAAWRRAVSFTDDEANDIRRRARVPVGVIVLSIFLRDFTVAALGPIDAVLAVALILTIAMSAATVFIFYAFRKPVARLIRTAFGSGGKEGGVVAFAASNWHIAYAAITVLSDSISFANEIGLSTGVSGTGYSLQVFVIVPFLLAALVVVREHYLTEAGNTRKSLIVGIAGLAQGALIVGAGILLLVSWGIDAFSPEGSGFEKLVATAVTSLLSIVCGVAVWRAAATLFDLHAPATAGDSSTPMDEDGGHKAASRFTTVYPVLRGFVLISIVAITAMIALSAFGVEIGPLIAGAGVVGIAVGFGAQTLVKDIISGIFYLQEDAFRVGEYISTSQGKGIVEKISLRSVRLRHHRGPVYTIPFGSMGTVENLSRDWVKIKFSFVVSSDQDLELIRKVVKKIGAALEEDPELEGKFLEPLKSQGAVGMNGPNYEIGVKFTCRPGEQFLIRRKAYVALQKALEEQGIELFQPKVVVSSATSPTEAAAAAMAQAPSN